MSFRINIHTRQLRYSFHNFLFTVLHIIILPLNAQNFNGGFEKAPYVMQETAPGMVLIEGGFFDFPEINGTRKDSVKSFYISAHEETNGQYLAYLNFISNCFSESTYKKALPDTMVWMQENIADSLKKFLSNNYLRGEAFKDYPVVGVSPEQIKKYAVWKTDRVNEMILIREGILDFMYYPKDSSLVFTTEGYLSGKWTGPVIQKLPSFDEKNPERNVRMEDGIFLPRYRLVLEKEWKLTSLAVGNKEHTYIKTPKESTYRKFDKQNYFGHLYVRRKAVKSMNALLISNALKLNAVYNFVPNNYFVRALNANVSEWVQNSKGQYVIAGGSWKNGETDCAAVYNKNGTYTYPLSFPVFKEAKVSAATGFRLAMDCVDGVIDSKIKRKKAK